VHDLLSDGGGVGGGDFRSKNLQLIENPISNGVLVQDMLSITVGGPRELLEALFKGQKKRAISSGSNNQTSSRSHVITELQILMTDKQDSESKMLSKVRFVDLAGSEKQIILDDKELVNEGSNINKSLLALTNCITILADDKKRDVSFIPFRNSKLTRILKDSLNGNTPLIMTVCITSNSQFVDETVNSLKYAEKAMAIKAPTAMSCYSRMTANNSGAYKSKVKEMEREIKYLKTMIAKGPPSGGSKVLLA
jgi:kinesin family protein 18/19